MASSTTGNRTLSRSSQNSSRKISVDMTRTPPTTGSPAAMNTASIRKQTGKYSLLCQKRSATL